MPTSDPPGTSPTLLRSLAIPGNELAWTIFVERYSPLILHHCRTAGLQAADAEEVRSRVLATLALALTHLRYDPARSFRGYLRAVVRSAIVGYWRERRRPGLTGSGCPEISEQLECVESHYPSDELGEAIEEDVMSRFRLIDRVVERVRGAVKPETWSAYWLTAIEGRAAHEAAHELGKSLGAVYMAKHRVAAMLAAEGKIFASPFSGTREEPA